MQSKNGGVAKSWTDRQWEDWLLYASTTATRLVEGKDYSAILSRRKEVLAEMERATNQLLSLMDESMSLMLVDGVSMPDRAVGMDKTSPPEDRALFQQVSELLLDVQYEQTLSVVDWLDARDRRLARVVNHETRLRYVIAFLEYTKGCGIAVSDRILAYQCTALYGLADASGDEFDRLLQSVNKARRAHEKRMKEPSYALVYAGDPKDAPHMMGYRPLGGNAVLSYWLMSLKQR